MFNITDKVALVTGAAGGIGLEIVRHLLKSNVKGVVVADINKELGSESVSQLQNEFSDKKIRFMQADVSNKTQFEDLFKNTIDIFGNLDILVNNAGIALESQWEKTISVNLTGTTNGTILGFEHYLPKYKSGDEAVIVNIVSTTSFEPLSCAPTYTATKCGILGLTRCYGSMVHYDRKQIKVIAVCPGFTKTAILSPKEDSFLNLEHRDLFNDFILPSPQSPSSVGSAVVKVIKEAKTGTIWVVEDGEISEINFPSKAELIKKS